jgi:hypothetical protein
VYERGIPAYGSVVCYEDVAWGDIRCAWDIDVEGERE